MLNKKLLYLFINYYLCSFYSCYDKEKGHTKSPLLPMEEGLEKSGSRKGKDPIEDNPKTNDINTPFTEFVSDLKKINKYTEIIASDKCNHDEKDHSNEELQIMEKFSKAMLDAINKLRTNPEYFLEKINKEKKFILDNLVPGSKEQYVLKSVNIGGVKTITHASVREENCAAYDDAIKYLKNYMSSETRLYKYQHYDSLMQSALLHAKAMAKHDVYGHTGVCLPIYIAKNKYLTHVGAVKHPEGSKKVWEKNYESVSNRISIFSRRMLCGENIGYFPLEDRSFNSLQNLAEEIVMGYFVDDGVEDRGHRLALVHNEYTHMGAAIYMHPMQPGTGKSQYYVDVMNFGKP